MFQGLTEKLANAFKKFRGKGYMAKLLKKAESFAKQNGKSFIALVPADEGLYSYYKRFGFNEAMYTSQGNRPTYATQAPFEVQISANLEGKEQDITITASSNLSDADIDKAIKDAEKYAEEDN